MIITRRAALTGAAGAMLIAPTTQAQSLVTHVPLRILATSDLHMFALDWDYYLDRTDSTVGLSKLATLIKKARSEVSNCMLLDNGDILQGSPMGDFVAAADPANSGGAHPFFVAMNALGYDAATLGNHEFNFGLPFLERSLKSADFPYVCANVYDAADRTLLPPFVILQRQLLDADGSLHNIRIGVIGMVPEQIMFWDRIHLEGKVRAQAILASAKRWLPQLRPQCDILIALCHSGIGDGRADINAENVAEQVAALDDVDVLIAGHSHRVFPGPDYVGRPGVDAQRGTLNAKPAVMPGFWGSHLGVIDLKLEQQGDRWRINDFHVEARPIYQRKDGKILALAETDTQIAAVFAKAHVQTRDWVSEPIGETETPLHSYFVWAGIDLPTELINRAQLDYGRSLLQGTPLSALPLLSAAAPFRVGYTPDAYIDLKAGPIAIRDAANMYTYSNTVSIVRVNGAIVKEWLEHSARVFHRIDTQTTDAQALLDPRVATYNFDVIEGLEYEIDLSQPQRTDASGRVAMAQAHRIKNLRHAGRPIDPAQDFLVVTNNYRAGGGGRFPYLDGRNIVLNDATTNRDALIEFIRKSGKLSAISQSPWKFSFGGRCIVWFDSAVSSRIHMADAPKLSLRGPGREGYLRYHLQID